ncbi:hypothetical protein FNF27_07709 [Cafeteria roenbergensis]|uniref:Cyclin-dependent kinase 2 homolog n=1 Tax=Cafeteria roenbergensis TaxID=33653 RepID=A0A5A8D001_CAFRO|nr:hypothetical protein FNF28_06236 [Cafeteria roenbergensis]KAA0165017.1 hypothetical protein FNF27_07709 [Cafeteria roenbergensis]
MAGTVAHTGGEHLPPAQDPLLGKDDRERYSKIEKLGEGTYGVVYKAEARSTGELVALKKIRVDTWTDGVPATAMREISSLRDIRHPCIVDLRDVFVSYSGNLYLVFELLDMDLKRVFDEHRKFDAAARRAAEAGTACVLPRPTTPSAYPQQPGGLPLEVSRAVLFQLLAGLNTCHERRYLHRDLKPQNVLVKRTGETKLADFGLARPSAVPARQYTHEVVTLWYRPPEVLLGGEVYTAALDLWSVGCIFAEMACGRPLFPGDSEIDQMHRVFEGLGTPNEDTWSGCTSLRNWRHDFPQWRGRGLAALVPGLPPSAAELLQAFLHFDPSCRISARNALRHPFLADMDVETSVRILATAFAGAPLPRIPQHALDGTMAAAAAAATTAAAADRGFVQPPQRMAASSSSSSGAVAAGGAGLGRGPFPTAAGHAAGPGAGAEAYPREADDGDDDDDDDDFEM